MALRICIGGMTGWVGSELATAIQDAKDMNLVAGVSRKKSGQSHLGVPCYASAEKALEAANCDIYIDYTHPTTAKANAQSALNMGAAVIMGTSGLTEQDYTDLDRLARERQLGLVASGNFSMTAALLQRFALMAARYVPDIEILDYAKSTKPDAPSGTARELAERLGKIAPYQPALAPSDLIGPSEIRGANIGGSRVHSVRLPGFILSIEAIFGAIGERLVLRHDAGESAEPYVAGTLLATRRVPSITGLVRGLDTLLFGEFS